MFALNPKALLALSSLALGGALLVSGCGGGGGGATTPTATSGPTATPTTPGVVFSDEFNSGSLNSSKWSTLDRTHVIQRTEFGNNATFGSDSDGTKFMRVNLDTFLPDDAARAEGKVQFYGTEIAGKTLIPRGNGVRFQARMRVGTPGRTGMVGSFFMFGQKGTYGGEPKLSYDEIDHELLTKAFAATPPYTWTNCYNDFRVPQPGLEGGDSYADETKNLGLAENYSTGYDSAGWNVYRIDWKPGQVEWFINDQLIRTDTSGRVPDDALAVRFNLWAAATQANGGWEAAADAAFTPAATAAENKTYSLDVDWVRVSGLNSTMTAAVSSRLQTLSDTQLMRGLSGPGYRSSKKR